MLRFKYHNFGRNLLHDVSNGYITITRSRAAKGDDIYENRLRYLVEQAGKCKENWKRNEHKVGGELHQCSTTKLHEQILAEFRTQYIPIVLQWLRNRKLAIARPHLRDTCWLKEGSMSTSNGVFAVVIPLPFEEHCEVQYQAKKDDLTTREALNGRTQSSF
ncbi:hypothetical protein V2G26_012200 [Clonostachys chloroleuca]